MEVVKENVMKIANQIYNNEHIEVLSLWDNILSEHTDLTNIKNHSSSLAALCLIMESIETDKLDEKLDLINKHKSSVKNFLQSYIEEDLKSNKDKGELIDKLINENNLEVGSSLLYHRIREAIGMQLFEMENNTPTYKIKDGNTTHVAKILTDVDEGMVLTNGEAGQWEFLMTQAIASMDDYTADTFDIISIMWMNNAKHPLDMISFSHEDVLSLRQLEKSKGGTGSVSYQKKQRVEVMKRLAAIASVWISIGEKDDFAIMESLDKTKDFNLSKYRRLFHIDNVTFAHDRQTNEAIGIYECDIRPSELLAKYLYGTKKTTSFLSLKALQYNPVSQKYHKRLTRYLSWQWRMRSKKKDFERPFNIGGDKGLLNAIGFDISEGRPIRTKERFETVLDKLFEDKVIAGWRYVEIDEEKIGNKGWFENYWTKLKLIIDIPEKLKYDFITPSKETLDFNKIAEFGKKLYSNPKDVTDYTQMQLQLEVATAIEPEASISFRKEIEVSPEIVKYMREKRGLSLSKAAEEIGIAHTTLSRYEKGLIKRPNSKNDERIKKWLNN